VSSKIPGETHPVTRLLPDRAETTVAEQLQTLELKELAPPDRPYLILNFATTLDGRAAISGKSGAIGSDTDTEVLQRLRTRVDAVMIGAGTMRAERYGSMPGERLMAIVSGSLELPWDAPLFTEGTGRVVVFTSSDAEPPATATAVSVVRHEDAVDLEAALRHLRSEHGIRALLSEGGPRLHAQMQALGLVDELFLTTSPKLTGGAAPRILEGELPEIEPLELAWLLEENGELFARYRWAR
jgi:riboflavin-specific deaminase-like protein